MRAEARVAPRPPRRRQWRPGGERAGKIAPARRQATSSEQARPPSASALPAGVAAAGGATFARRARASGFTRTLLAPIAGLALLRRWFLRLVHGFSFVPAA